jgi:hypothetical protein
MVRRFLLCGLVALAGTVGVRAEEKAKPAEKAEAVKADANPQFEQLKTLAGTWVEADKDGKPTDKVVSVIKLIGGGSVVHETLFPGEPMEMVSVYHLDKGELVMTHYCAIGNQPKMKADPKSPKDQIKFDFVGGTNLDPAKDMHMHGGTLKFIDADHIEFSGEAWVDGKPAKDHCGTMKLVRKK